MAAAFPPYVPFRRSVPFGFATTASTGTGMMFQRNGLLLLVVVVPVSWCLPGYPRVCVVNEAIKFNKLNVVRPCDCTTLRTGRTIIVHLAAQTRQTY